MRSLSSVVADSKVRPKVVADTVGIIDAEVARKGGVTGFALKAGYQVVKQLKGGRMVPAAVDALLDDFARAIEPLRAEYAGATRVDGFDRFLEKHADRAANALLSITDSRAAKAEAGVLRKTYEKLRPMAIGHVKEALPAVGRLVERYTKE